MSELFAFIHQLISAPGLSGYEKPVRDLIEDAWRPFTDELQTSRLGSLHALRKGQGPEPRPRILIEAHMDAIGLMVKGLVGEFIRIAPIGGVDHRVLPGQMVTVHGCEDVRGIIVCPPANRLPKGAGDPPSSLDYLLIDTGLPPKQLEETVHVGNLVSFAQVPLQMSDRFLAGHSLDNRASVAALTLCLQEMKNHPVCWDVWAAATALEEESLGGALTSAFQIQPDLAVVLDVTFGRGPASPDYLTFPLGKGPTLSWGPVIHPGLHKAFRELAERLKIPFQIEPIPQSTYTNADMIHTVAHGIPTMLIEIPIRYMHTATEMVSLDDIRYASRLLVEFITRLDSDFLTGLSRDD
jgi:tetrahedral aminopeptidase